MNEVTLLGIVVTIALVGLMVTPSMTSMVYFGPEYTSSGYYGRRKMELRGYSSPEGYEAAEACRPMDTPLQCCFDTCQDDLGCLRTCERIVTRQSYQYEELGTPAYGNIYG